MMFAAASPVTIVSRRRAHASKAARFSSANHGADKCRRSRPASAHMVEHGLRDLQSHAELLKVRRDRAAQVMERPMWNRLRDRTIYIFLRVGKPATDVLPVTENTNFRALQARQTRDNFDGRVREQHNVLAPFWPEPRAASTSETRDRFPSTPFQRLHARVRRSTSAIARPVPKGHPTPRRPARPS